MPEIRAPWRDPNLPLDERTDALLAALTLDEKAAQLGSTWPGAETAEGDVAPMQETHLRAASFEEEIRGGLGQITRVYGTAPVTAEDGRRHLTRMQHAVVAGNRLGIPAIAHEECLTGVTAWRATVYPTPLAWGASFDPATVHAVARRIGDDLRVLGIQQGLSPVLDVVRDYRWGRVEETIGEDPHLVAEIGAAYVQGLEDAGVVATPKHFAGYSASRGARNHAPVSMGPRELAGVILPTAAFAIPVCTLVLTGSMRNIGHELYEAMAMDGAGSFTVYRRMVLPLSKGGLATIVVFAALQAWNGFLLPLVLARTPETTVATVALNQFRSQYAVNVPGLMAAVILTIIPILLVHLFARRALVAGVMGMGGK